MAACPLPLWDSFPIAQGRPRRRCWPIAAPEELGKAIIYAVMVETYAVLALLASIMLLFGINF